MSRQAKCGRSRAFSCLKSNWVEFLHYAIKEQNCEAFWPSFRHMLRQSLLYSDVWCFSWAGKSSPSPSPQIPLPPAPRPLVTPLLNTAQGEFAHLCPCFSCASGSQEVSKLWSESTMNGCSRFPVQCLWVRRGESQPSRVSPALCKTDVSKEQIPEADFTQDASTVVFWFVLGLRVKSRSPSWLHFRCFDTQPQAVSARSGYHRNETLRNVLLSPATRQPSPGTSTELAPNAQKLAVGGSTAIFLL